MRIYVAAKFEEKERVKALYDALEKAGHQITHKWIGEDASGLVGEALKSYLRTQADRDVEGVVSCDVLVLLPHEKGRGLYVELGVALAFVKPVVAVGSLESAPNCIFLTTDEVVWVEEDEDVVPALYLLEGCQPKVLQVARGG